jgi:2-methylisocitrate lyase-like PEP mutase family enzyme
VTSTTGERVDLLRALHVPGDPLVLPNVWDAASAHVVEEAGFLAVATGSAAVAAALGYADGEATPVGEMFDAVARVARVVGVPVTADVERGYGLPPAELVERLATAGAVGCNIEDSEPRTGTLVDAERQADFLAEVRATAVAGGHDLVINARVDTYAHGTGTATERLAESLRRARRYLAAGADCVYPILVTDVDAMRALVTGIAGPVNLLCRPGSPSVVEYAAMGAARVSFGPGLHHVVQSHLARLAATIAAGGDPYAGG